MICLRSAQTYSDAHSGLQLTVGPETQNFRGAKLFFDRETVSRQSVVAREILRETVPRPQRGNSFGNPSSRIENRGLRRRLLSVLALAGQPSQLHGAGSDGSGSVCVRGATRGENCYNNPLEVSTDLFGCPYRPVAVASDAS